MRQITTVGRGVFESERSNEEWSHQHSRKKVEKVRVDIFCKIPERAIERRTKKLLHLLGRNKFVVSWKINFARFQDEK